MRRNTFFRLDPRTKLLLLLLISLVAMMGYEGPILAVRPWLLCFPMLLLVLAGKTLTAGKWAAVYVMVYYWDKILFFLPEGGSWRTFVQIILSAFVAFMPCLMMGRYIVATTTAGEFIAAMQKMHITQNITIPFVVLFRFFPTIAEEYHAIQDAMKMRGIGFGKGPAAMLEYRLVPLMISMVKIGDELSAAAAARGLGDGEVRTSVCEVGFGILDMIVFVFAIGVIGYARQCWSS